MKEKLLKMVEEGLVNVQKHPNADLFIYNYSPRVQYESLWDEVTIAARGLILDADMNIVAKPFSKFFNIEEHDATEIPQLPFEIFDKLDGSLGILYWLEGMPYIATRGSFISEQSQHATEILYTKYSHTFDKLNRNATYLFEIIYPQNRIVVNYGDTDDLFLLTAIDNESGEEFIHDIGFPIVKRYDGINDLAVLKGLEEDNREGFVVRFSNGFRIKVKFEEYVRLHRIITNVSNLTIWEYLMEEKDFEELLTKVPDEFYDWVRMTKDEIVRNYNAVLESAKKRYADLWDADRKTFALRVMNEANDISAILFRMYDGKKVDPIVWKKVRPIYGKAFVTNADNG